MAQLVEVKVPDIGDFKDVAVIELMVKPGEVIAVDTGLIMVESDKASMEIPSTHAGVGEGDEGQARRQGERRLGDPGRRGGGRGCGRAVAAPRLRRSGRAGLHPRRPRRSRARSPAPRRYTGKADIECEMLVLGAGPGGYSAAFRSADLGMKTVLVERYADARRRVPERRLHPVEGAAAHRRGDGRGQALCPTTASSYGAPEIDLDKLRGFKDGVVKKLTGGLAGMAKARKVEVLTGVGSFLDPYHVEVARADGGKKVVKFAKAIIAAGSQAVKLPFMPEDERIVDSTGALLLKSIPKRMLVVGGGIIGLEMATVYSTLGTRIDVVEMLDGLMQGADRDLVKVWEKINAHRFDHVMLKTKTVGAKATQAGIEVSFEGEKAPEGAAALRPGAGGGRPQPERQEDRRRQGRRRGHRPRLHRRRQADAHQRAAHLSRSATSSASRCWRTRRCTKRTWRPRSRTAKQLLRRAPDSVGGLHRPRGGLGRQDRGASARPRASSSARRCSRGRPRAAPSPTAATRASPS